MFYKQELPDWNTILNEKGKGVFYFSTVEIPQSLDKIVEIERRITEYVDKIYKEFKDVNFPFNEELFEELVNKIFYLVK